MSLGDDIIFWQEHFARPPLATSIPISGGDYEVMLDDGTVVMRPAGFLFKLIDRYAREAVREICAEQSEFWKRVQANLDGANQDA